MSNRSGRIGGNRPAEHHTAHSVPVRALKEEARFYNDAQHARDGIEDFRRRVERQNQEFNTLLQYYQQNEGRIDFSGISDGNGGLRPHRPNLGTDSQSWFYLDERGNKIWVQNMQLDTADAKSGAFAANQHADGRVIVVKVPTHKKNYCLQPDYKKKCMEYSYRRLQQMQSPTATSRPASAHSRGRSASRPGTAGSVRSPSVGGGQYPMPAPFSGHQNGAAAWVPGSAATSYYHTGGGAEEAVDDQTLRYVEGQQRLASQVVHHQQSAYRGTYPYPHPSPHGPYAYTDAAAGAPLMTQGGHAVYRPPTTVEEADARLEALRQEEAWLRQQVAM